MTSSSPCSDTYTLARRLGVESLVLNAPVPGAVTPELVAAVCEAGGLGVVPGGTMSAQALGDFIEAVRGLTGKPFAVALSVPPVKTYPLPALQARQWAVRFVELFGAVTALDEGVTLMEIGRYDPEPAFEQRFAVVTAARPAAFISTFAGLREQHAEALKAAGTVYLAGVTSLREAKVMRAAGADGLIVQGAEAGGLHWAFEDRGVEAGLLGLIPHVVRATELPVIAAGGIVLPEQAAACRVLGAQGVMAGTAFLPVAESAADGFRLFGALQTGPSDYRRAYTGSQRASVYPNALGMVLIRHGEVLRDAPPGLFEHLLSKIDDAATRSQAGNEVLLSVGQAAGRLPYGRAADVVRALAGGLK